MLQEKKMHTKNVFADGRILSLKKEDFRDGTHTHTMQITKMSPKTRRRKHTPMHGTH